MRPFLHQRISGSSFRSRDMARNPKKSKKIQNSRKFEIKNLIFLKIWKSLKNLVVLTPVNGRARAGCENENHHRLSLFLFLHPVNCDLALPSGFFVTRTDGAGAGGIAYSGGSMQNPHSLLGIVSWYLKMLFHGISSPWKLIFAANGNPSPGSSSSSSSLPESSLLETPSMYFTWNTQIFLLPVFA